MRFASLYAVLLLTATAAAQSPAATTAPTTAPHPNKYGIIVSPETTGLTAPLREDGTVDYIAAINARFGKDVTPENNAAIPLLQAVGTPAITSHGEQLLKCLGIADPGLGCWHPWLGFHKDQTPADKADFIELASNPWAKEPKVEAWLKANEHALALAVQAADRPRLFWPLVSRTDDPQPQLITISPGHLLSCKQMAQALCIRAMHRISEGDQAGAWDDLRASHALASLLTQDPFVRSSAVAVSIHEATCQSDIAFLTASPCKLELLRKVASDFAGFGGMPDLAEVYGRCERYNFNDAIQDLARKDAKQWMEHLGLKDAADVDATVDAELGKQGLPRLDYNCILRRAMKTLDELSTPTAGLTPEQLAIHQERLARVCKEIDDTYVANDGGHGDAWRWPKLAETRDAYSDRFGTVLLAGCFEDFHIGDKLSRIAARHMQAAQVFVAIECYHVKNSIYPAKLADLVPQYLAKVPEGSKDFPLTYQATPKGFHFAWVRSSDPVIQRRYNQHADITFEVKR